MGTFATVLAYVKRVKPDSGTIYESFVNPKTNEVMFFSHGIDFTENYAADLSEGLNKLWEMYEKWRLTDCGSSVE